MLLDQNFCWMGFRWKPALPKRVSPSCSAQREFPAFTFSPQVQVDQFQHLVMGFAESKPAALLENLKNSLGSNSGIKVNEVTFIAHDSGNPTTVAAEIAAATLGGVPGHMAEWLTDPKKLLQLISAAEGAHSSTQVGQIVAAHEAEVKAPLQEEDVLGVIRFLSTCGDPADGQVALDKLNAEAQQIPSVDTRRSTRHSIRRPARHSTASRRCPTCSNWPSIWRSAMP